MTKEEQEFECHMAAEEAIRDILYMYKTFSDYQDLFDDFDAEDGKFDPFTYIDIQYKEYDSADKALLHAGSALKLLCYILQCWDQGGYLGKSDPRLPEIDHIKKLLEQGRVAHMPDLEFALKTALVTDDWSQIGCQALYEKYVASYFQSLVADPLPITASRSG